MVVEMGRRGVFIIPKVRYASVLGLLNDYRALFARYRGQGLYFIYKSYILESMAFTESSLAALRAGR